MSLRKDWASCIVLAFAENSAVPVSAGPVAGAASLPEVNRENDYYHLIIANAHQLEKFVCKEDTNSER